MIYINLRKPIQIPGLNVGIVDIQVLDEAMYVSQYSKECMLTERRCTKEGTHLWNRLKIKGHQKEFAKSNQIS